MIIEGQSDFSREIRDIFLKDNEDYQKSKELSGTTGKIIAEMIKKLKDKGVKICLKP